MNNEVWQQLTSLESRDVIKKWFYQLHNRKLSSRRALEISAAFKQAREYFSNASKSDYSVKPLLTFYGVSSLSRSLTLLLNWNGGEEKITQGHGLESNCWSNTLSGDISNALSNIGDLKITTRNGLFTDFLNATKNSICIHVNSSAVDWRIDYKIPIIGNEIIFKELLSRIPDLENDINHCSSPRYATIQKITYTEKDGVFISTNNKPSLNIYSSYEKNLYSVTKEEKSTNLTASSNTFATYLPLFAHKYIHKTFGSIPTLYLIEPFENGMNYSEICMAFIVSYYLGMLVRYYPTQWISLTNGESGDLIWPLLNRAHNYVEKVFPELAIELIKRKMTEGIERCG